MDVPRRRTLIWKETTHANTVYKRNTSTVLLNYIIIHSKHAPYYHILTNLSESEIFQCHLRIDNGDLGTMWPQWSVFSDILVIYYSI